MCFPIWKTNWKQERWDNQKTPSEDISFSAISKGLDYDGTELYIALSILAVIIFIGFCIGLYVLVAVMARERNRSQVLWVLVALVTTLILGINILLCIGLSCDDSMPIE